MEKQLTDRMVEILAKRLPAGSELRMADVLSAPLPAGVRAWMSGTIAGRVAKELGPDLSHVEGRGPIRRIAHALVVARVPQYRIGRDDLLRLLGEATAFVEAYLRRPRSMLEGFLLAGGERVSVPEIASRLDMITEYRYLGVVLLRLLSGRAEVERRELRRLIARVDEEVVRTHGPEELARLMAPMFSWYGLAGIEGVPHEAVQDFLDDKGLDGLRDYLEGIAKITGEKTLTAEEIGTYAADLLPKAGAAEPATPAPTPPGNEEAVSAPAQEAPRQPQQEELQESERASGDQGEAGATAEETEAREGNQESRLAAFDKSRFSLEEQGDPVGLRDHVARGAAPEAPKGQTGPPKSEDVDESLPLWLQGFSRQAPAPQEATRQNAAGQGGQASLGTEGPASEVGPKEAEEAGEVISKESPVTEPSPSAQPSGLAQGPSGGPSASSSEESVAVGKEPAKEREPRRPIWPEREPLPSPWKPRASASTNPAHESFKENVRRNFALSLTSAGMKERVTPPKPQLGSVFTEEQRTTLTSSLFKNDPTEFTRIVDAVGGLASWKEAARYLTDFLETQRLNPYAKDVMEFTGAVRQWFVGKEERP